MKESSHKNLLIALGVAVAAIIVFTAFYFSDGALSFQPYTNSPSVPKKPTPQVIIKKISERIIPMLHSLHK
jgi:hypothetical protein